MKKNHYNKDNFRKKVFNSDYSCMGLEHMMVYQKSLCIHSFIPPILLDYAFIKIVNIEPRTMYIGKHSKTIEFYFYLKQDNVLCFKYVFILSQI